MSEHTQQVIRFLKNLNGDYKKAGFVPTLDLVIEDLETPAQNENESADGDERTTDRAGEDAN